MKIANKLLQFSKTQLFPEILEMQMKKYWDSILQKNTTMSTLLILKHHWKYKVSNRAAYLIYDQRQSPTTAADEQVCMYVSMYVSK